MDRRPFVAGQFYPGKKKELLEELNSLFSACADAKKIDAIGAVVPHAGYIYSGRIAAEVYAKIKPKKTYVILCPNHTSYGARFAVTSEAWLTPLGRVEIDREFLDELISSTELIEEDSTAHLSEHAIEVHLPFIQKTAPVAKIVPICVKSAGFQVLKEAADAITRSVEKRAKEVIIIASSDMTHYECRDVVKAKDNKAIQKILGLDAKGLIEVVEKNNITMCGYVPAAIMLMCVQAIGARKAKLLKYADSGDVTGEIFSVVGYAGIVIY